MATRLVIDSSNVNPISEAELRASGAVALIAKATEGTTFKDKTYPAHRAAAKAVGIPFGSYLFLHAGSIGDEADFYLDYAKPKPGDLQPIIDAEQGGQDGKTINQVAARVHACASALEARGYAPILYSDVAYWKQLVAAKASLARLYVWEAQYPGRYQRWLPRLAALRIRLGSGASIAMWQWTSDYAVGGKHFDASRLFVPLAKIIIPR